MPRGAKPKPAELRRTEIIHVRFTPDERARLESVARATGLELAVWLRFVCLNRVNEALGVP